MAKQLCRVTMAVLQPGRDLPQPVSQALPTPGSAHSASHWEHRPGDVGNRSPSHLRQQHIPVTSLGPACTGPEVAASPRRGRGSCHQPRARPDSCLVSLAVWPPGSSTPLGSAPVARVPGRCLVSRQTLCDRPGHRGTYLSCES